MAGAVDHNGLAGWNGCAEDAGDVRCCLIVADTDRVALVGPGVAEVDVVAAGRVRSAGSGARVEVALTRGVGKPRRISQESAVSSRGVVIPRRISEENIESPRGVGIARAVTDECIVPARSRRVADNDPRKVLYEAEV